MKIQRKLIQYQVTLIHKQKLKQTEIKTTVKLINFLQ